MVDGEGGRVAGLRQVGLRPIIRSAWVQTCSPSLWQHEGVGGLKCRGGCSATAIKIAFKIRTKTAIKIAFKIALKTATKIAVKIAFKLAIQIAINIAIQIP